MQFNFTPNQEVPYPLKDEDSDSLMNHIFLFPPMFQRFPPLSLWTRKIINNDNVECGMWTSQRFHFILP